MSQLLCFLGFLFVVYLIDSGNSRIRRYSWAERRAMRAKVRESRKIALARERAFWSQVDQDNIII